MLIQTGSVKKYRDAAADRALSEFTKTLLPAVSDAAWQSD